MKMQVIFQIIQVQTGIIPKSFSFFWRHFFLSVFLSKIGCFFRIALYTEKKMVRTPTFGDLEKQGVNQMIKQQISTLSPSKHSFFRYNIVFLILIGWKKSVRFLLHRPYGILGVKLGVKGSSLRVTNSSLPIVTKTLK